MKTRLVGVVFSTVLLVTATFAERPKPAGPADAMARQIAWEQHQTLSQSSLFRGLPWRCVGPLVQGGRLVDIESVPGKPYTFYVAYASGGLWRTENNGVTFEPLFDQQPSMIIGDIAIDPSHPDTIWVGSGEHNSSRSTYGGAGLFRSDDAGKTWRFAGLGDSDRIGRIMIDPRDSKHVTVAVLGRLYTPGGERGIYATTDGGATWKQVLAGNPTAGFIDLVMDPKNPEVLYAASWERLRRPWEFIESGEGSGIWKSTDGGANWKRLGGGFPSGKNVGRIGLAIAASKPSTVYAVLDNQDALPESEWDLGDGNITPKKLRKMTKEELLTQDNDDIEDFLRSSGLDPAVDAAKLKEMLTKGEITVEDILKTLKDANSELFESDVRGAEVYRSDDSGATWRRTHQKPLKEVFYTYGYYFAKIRVAPDNPERIYVLGVPLITSNDGGKTFAFAGGRGVHSDHQAMLIDPVFPGRVIDGNDGGLNMTFDGGKSWLKLNTTPVGQFYAVTVDMAKPYNIYGGLQDNGMMKGSSTIRLGSGADWQSIGGGDGMYLQVDPRDNATTYLGSQFGNYSRITPGARTKRIGPTTKLKDEPFRWNWCTPILLSKHSPDILYMGANKLFRSLDKGETFVPISPDLTTAKERGNVPFATITTIAESPKTFGLLWVGTDDGHVHVTRDGGVEWKEVSNTLVANRWVTRIEASAKDEKAAYVSFSGYRDDDIAAYLYRTDNLGASWTFIGAGLPPEGVNVVREDPVNSNVLYVGTDRGAYVSTDRGGTWQALAGGLPNVPVHDLVVHPRDRELVAGTHGRSVWVLDVLPIQELTVAVKDKALHVFPLEDLTFRRDWKSKRSTWYYRPEDDPFMRIPFWAKTAGKAGISILDSDGRVLRKAELDVIAGINTYTWDLLLDKDLAVAAEKAKVAAGVSKSSPGAGKTVKDKKPEPASEKGKPNKAPWAEAVRLDRPIYVTPGSYRIQVEIADGKSDTEIEVKPAEPREPRVKPVELKRGEKKPKKETK